MDYVKDHGYPKVREWNAKVFSLPKIPRGEEGQHAVLKTILKSVIDKVPYNTRIQFIGSNSKSTLEELCVWLRPVGLVYKEGGTWGVSDEGRRWMDTEDDLYLTSILCANVRFMAELLVRLDQPKKMDELLKVAIEEYKLNWKTTSEINNRLTWFRQLELVEFKDYQLTYSLTEKGRKFVSNITYVRPEEIILSEDQTADELELPLSDWAKKMCQLNQEDLEIRKSSIGYIPGNISEVCDTLSGYVQLMYKAINLDSIISYSKETYNIADSSTRSFISTLITLDLIERKTKTLYETTELGKKWMESKFQLDFVCCLQTKVLFVLEILKELEKESLSIKKLAAIAKVSYGFESEKIEEVRKRVNILRGALLIQEDGGESYCLTERGKKFIKMLPVQQKSVESQMNRHSDGIRLESTNLVIDEQLTELRLASKDSSNPSRFEKAVKNAFTLLGFKAEWLGGSGKTDVLLHSPSVPKHSFVVTVDAKSTQSGTVTEGQINFDTIKEHKKLHSADYASIVGFSFQGDRVVKRAIEHNVVLIDINSLEKLIRLHKEVPLHSQSYRKMFSHPGMINISLLDDDRRTIKRNGKLLQAVMDCLVEESNDPVTEGFLQDKDIYRTLRNNVSFDTPPTVEEISVMLNFLASPLIGCAGQTKEGFFALGALSDAANKFYFYAQACE